MVVADSLVVLTHCSVKNKEHCGLVLQSNCKLPEYALDAGLCTDKHLPGSLAFRTCPCGLDQDYLTRAKDTSDWTGPGNFRGVSQKVCFGLNSTLEGYIKNNKKKYQLMLLVEINHNSLSFMF